MAAALPRRIAMTNTKKLLLIPVAVLAAACGRDESKADEALKNDLSLASQAQPYSPQQVTSAAEMGYAYNPYTGQFQPIPQAQAQVQTVSRPRTTTTSRRTSTRSTGSSSGNVVYQPAPAPTVKRNTKRDAVIGAAAGAVIGATTSR